LNFAGDFANRLEEAFLYRCVFAGQE